MGALSLFSLARAGAQVIERPVPFDSSGLVTVMTPFLADKAALRPPWWPVAGEFTDARLFTVNDSTYVLAVTRRTGVVERYSLSGADRDAIRAVVSRLPRDVILARADARNAFVRGQTLLGLVAYGPTFAGAVGNNAAGRTAGYLVVAGGTFFAASEISRRMLVSRPQADLSFNLGHNGALAGWAAMYLLHASNQSQSGGAFIGGLAGAGLALRVARGMTEPDAIGAAFGSDVSALIGWGTAETLKGTSRCTQLANGTIDCAGRIPDRAVVAIVLGSGLIGYPLGVLYPRNAAYNVTAGDIQTLWPSTILGALTANAFVGSKARTSTVAAALTGGGLAGMVLGDRFLVRRFDHSRVDGGRVTLGALAGGLVGAGIAALTDTRNPSARLASGLAAAGGVAGIMVTERYLDPSPDIGRPAMRLTFDPASIFLIAARTPGNHSLLNVRF